jgi:hypothetical protein
MTATWSVKSTVIPMTARVLLCIAAAALSLGACRDGKDRPITCGDDQPQAIDPSSSQHLLPGAPEPAYTTNPPTSGAHAPGNHPTGVLTAPIAKPAQVAMLEAGGVLIQYDDIPAAELRELESIVSEHEGVTIAPNDTLTRPVVATAWTYRMLCSAVDKTALESFVKAHAGKAPSH